MAIINVKLSQSTVNKLNQLPDEGSSNLSEIFGQIVETNAHVSETFSWANSWSVSGNKVNLKFGNIANLTYTGSITPYVNAPNEGIALASSRVLSAPKFFKESVYGELQYEYFSAAGYLSYTNFNFYH
jgi:hypothetical protein